MRGSRKVLGCSLYFDLSDPNVCTVQSESYSWHGPVSDGGRRWRIGDDSHLTWADGAWQPRLTIQTGRHDLGSYRTNEITQVVLESFLAWERRRNARAVVAAEYLDQVRAEYAHACQVRDRGVGVTPQTLQHAVEAAVDAREQIRQLSAQISSLQRQLSDLRTVARRPEQLAAILDSHDQAVQEVESAHQRIQLAERIVASTRAEPPAAAAPVTDVAGLGLTPID